MSPGISPNRPPTPDYAALCAAMDRASVLLRWWRNEPDDDSRKVSAMKAIAEVSALLEKV